MTAPDGRFIRKSSAVDQQVALGAQPEEMQARHGGANYLRMKEVQPGRVAVQPRKTATVSLLPGVRIQAAVGLGNQRLQAWIIKPLPPAAAHLAGNLGVEHAKGAVG